MTAFDWLAVGLVVVLAVAGAARGLVAGALATVGIVAGVVLGAKIAPVFLPSDSPYTPLAALAGAILLAGLLEAVGTTAGALVRSRLRLRPLRTLDSAGGLVLGAGIALAVVWILGVVALHLPGQSGLRKEAQRSAVFRRLADAVPPRDVLSALARVDPFPEIAGPLADVPPPSRAVLRNPAIRRAARSVVRVEGTACGLGITGSGWVAGPGLVVTAAHVVAGQDHPSVDGETATPVAFDSHDDVAVLRVRTSARPLALADPESGTPVALVGFPQGGGLTAVPGRVGRTTRFFTRDAYGRGPVLRTITSLSGRIRPGDSGGPAIDRNGRVETMMFASRVGTSGGYGVPPSDIQDALDGAHGSVSTGPCAR